MRATSSVAFLRTSAGSWSRAAIRLAPSRNMPLGRTSIPEFPDSGPPRPPSQHIEMSACFPSSSHRGRTHAVQTRGARDKILPVLRSCGRYVVALYNTIRPHASIGYKPPATFPQRHTLCVVGILQTTPRGFSRSYTKGNVSIETVFEQDPSQNEVCPKEARWRPIDAA